MNSTIAKTAVLLIDPYNDFLDPAGKVHGMIAESLATTDPILKIQAVVAAARVKGIPIYYGLHQQCNANFLAGWKHATGTQKSQEAEKAFEAGSWGAEIFPGLQPDAEKGDVVVGKHWCSRWGEPQPIVEPADQTALSRTPTLTISFVRRTSNMWYSPAWLPIVVWRALDVMPTSSATK